MRGNLLLGNHSDFRCLSKAVFFLFASVVVVNAFVFGCKDMLYMSYMQAMSKKDFSIVLFPKHFPE